MHEYQFWQKGFAKVLLQPNIRDILYIQYMENGK